MLFSDCSIDHATEFDDIIIQNSGADEYEARAKIFGQLADLCISSREISQHIHYKRLEQYADGRKKFLEVKDADTMRNGGMASLINYVAHEYSRLTMSYGYSIGRVIITSVIVLLLSAILFAALECTGNGLAPMTAACGSAEGLVTLGIDAIYFSVVTFTSLGYGDITPVGFARLVVLIEALGGVVLSAQFVYVIANRTSI